MSTDGSIAEQVLEVARSAVAGAPNEQARERAQAVVDRLSGPLRVAIAGRVKAGKSTLLNALVGERLAPTDAGECTKVVSRYRRGSGYQVSAIMRDGRTEQLAFTRTGGSLDVQLGGLSERDVQLIDVLWPTTALETITLIDTPGLASINDENSRRTREFLEHQDDRPSDADAVIYLMRHAHRSDVAFLDAFMDRSVTSASPVNAVAVLSRADEIGAGRLDAMESSTKIAARYQADPQLRGLCAAVVPLAGLLAETGLTLREDEVAALRMLAATDADVLERMLLSAGQFCDTSASDLTVELRRSLIDRLGLFGVRLALAEIRAGNGTTAATLGPILVRHSGLTVLRQLISQHFMPRARVLQARSGLVALRSLARSLEAVVPVLAADIDRRLEHLESSTVQFAQVRAAHLLACGAASVAAGEVADLERLFNGSPSPTSLGLAPSTPAQQVQVAALSAIARWRTQASDPLADPTTVEVYDIATRVVEQVFGSAMPG
ncbi:MAG: dynamin family protein [Actinomycetota bacterium]|nr:dynamin family protein [Actinomycetota bacterium]